MFQGKTIIVTGGSLGIGFAVAKEIHAGQGTPIIIGHNKQHVYSAMKRLDKPAYSYLCDVSSVDEITQTMKKIKKK
jgi:short-subunit dehydrogenase involved in D-alanine esterification of teichoic acids